MRVLLALRDIARVVSPQLVTDDPAKLPYTLDWPSWQPQGSIGATAHGMSRSKVKEALQWAYEQEAIEFSQSSKNGDQLPLILLHGCLEKLDCLLVKLQHSNAEASTEAEEAGDKLSLGENGPLYTPM
jgi:hypothetical protein